MIEERPMPPTQADHGTETPPILRNADASSWPSRLLFGSVFLAIAIIVAFFALVDPTEAPLYPKCPLLSASGLHCPTCGASRALHALVHGEWQVALDRNAFVVGAFPLVGTYLIAHVFQLRLRKCAPEFPTRLVLTAVILMLAFGIARNIPIAPLSQLAP